MNFGRKRRAIGWASGVFTASLFGFALLWLAFYYGVLLPLQTTVTASFPYAFDSLSLAFVDFIIEWWPFFVVIADLLWLWQRSNKTGLSL